MSDVTAIQVSISGYSGKPVTLLSIYKKEAQVLAISDERDFRLDKIEKCLVITNDAKLDRDCFFKEEFLKKAIVAYFGMKNGVSANNDGGGRLVISEKAMRCNPENAIEIDGMDANGPRYRVAESISNAQIAALATCWYADSQAKSIDTMLSMMDDIIDIDKTIRRGGVYTI